MTHLTDFAQKQTLREQLQARRAALTTMQRANMDAAISARVQSLPIYRTCTAVFSYVSVREEVDTLALIRAALRDGKPVAVPRCEGRRMVFYIIDALERLVPGRFGLLEPSPGMEAVPDSHSVCLVPGLSFDRSGARIGYGGGFYDRFLPNFPGLSIGLCYTPLLSQSPLPVEPHDCRVAIVVSDRGSWETNPAGNR